MNRKILALVEASSLKSEVPSFDIGDTVDVHTRILEGDKPARVAARRLLSAASSRAKEWSGSFRCILQRSPRSR